MLTRPPYAGEQAGLEAIQLAESVGLVLDPWQRMLVRLILAHDAAGAHAAREVGFLVSRQNGKGAVLEAVTLYGMFLVSDPLTLWTAHQFKTSGEAFLRVRGWIDGSDDLRRRVARMNAAHGEEGVELLPRFGSARLRFLARSKSSGRGFSPQRIIFDEAQELATVAIEAMLPSMRAQSNPQAIFTGTVPGPEVNHPEHWTRLRDRGRAGFGRLAWAEWSPAGSWSPDASADLDDRWGWAQANPGLGYRAGLTWSALEADRDTLADDSFARECLSFWPSSPAAGTPIFGAHWEECFDPDAELPAAEALGLAVSTDHAFGSLAVCGDSVRPHVGAVAHQRGDGWLVGEAARIQAESGADVVVNGKGPAADLIRPLEDAGVRVTVAGTADYLDACELVFRLVSEGGMSWFTPDLDAAARVAGWRRVGERRAFGHRASRGDMSMLEAATLAVWAVREQSGAEPFVGWV